MTQSSKIGFDEQIADFKRMVILRQNECEQIHSVVAPTARRQAYYARIIKVFIISCGALIATKGGIDLIMANLNLSKQGEQLVNVVYLLLGALVSMTAALESAFNFGSKAGQLSSLASQCQKFNRTFMSDYIEKLVGDDQRLIVERLQFLIKAQNDGLEKIHDQANQLGVDLSSADVKYRI